MVREMAIALNPFGSVNFQLRLENKQPITFEINARSSGTTIMRALAGFNEIETIIKYLIFNERKILKAQKNGVFLRRWDELFISWEQFNKMSQAGVYE